MRLVIDEMHATHDQAILSERRLGHFADSAVGVVGDRLPASSAICAIWALTIFAHRNADGVLTALARAVAR